jgi:hypothetical protein
VVRIVTPFEKPQRAIRPVVTTRLGGRCEGFPEAIGGEKRGTSRPTVLIRGLDGPVKITSPNGRTACPLGGARTPD